MKEFLSGCLIAALLLFAAACSPSGLSESRSPNIVLIFSDDLGYADLGATGSGTIKTPHIDKMAREGRRFTNAYVTASICSPSRAGMISGRYQQRFGYEDNTGPPTHQPAYVGLPANETTLAEALKKRGYTTGIVGKWHLGQTRSQHPQSRGFDEFFGMLHGGHIYFGPDSKGPLVRGWRCVDQDRGESDYLTDTFTEEGLAFIERHQDEKFFLYMSYNAVHTPYQAPASDLEKVNSLVTEEGQRKYVAMVQSLDDDVGRIRSKLEEFGIADNTLLVFFNDNGGLAKAKDPASNTPFRGGKGNIYEGGIRVPLIMVLPGTIEGGEIYTPMVSSLDLFPTFLGLAGAVDFEGTKPLDGIDLIPHLSGKTLAEPHAQLYWRRQKAWAIRDGDFKLLNAGNGGGDELYNLLEDPSESTNVIDKNPEITDEMKTAYDNWDATLMDPLWEWQSLSDTAHTTPMPGPHPASWLENFPDRVWEARR